MENGDLFAVAVDCSLAETPRKLIGIVMIEADAL